MQSAPKTIAALAALAAFAALALFGAGPALALQITYTDKATYLAATAASQATAPFGNSTAQFSSYVSDSATFTAPVINGYGYFFSMTHYTPLLAGNELSMAVPMFSALNVRFATPVNAFGMGFVKPQATLAAGFAFTNSSFTVSMVDNTKPVGSFSFAAPTDVAAFFGGSNTLAFNNVQIRETVGGTSPEFFGQVYTAATLPVPEPQGWMLLVAGLSTVAALSRRRLQRDGVSASTGLRG